MRQAIERVLLTNDDGVHAPGLRVLEEIAATLAEEVWVVAPERDQSGTAHSVTLHEPVRLKQLGERRFSVTGTPSDAVIMACQHVMRSAPPQLVLSGVNRGANVADAVAYSGTLGAATTALILGVPAMALSQGFREPSAVPWETAAAFGPPLLQALLDASQHHHVCFSINFPPVPPEQVTAIRPALQGRGSIRGVHLEHRTDTRGLPYFWFRFEHDYRSLRQADTDVDVLRHNAIAVSPLRLERDHPAIWGELSRRLAAIPIHAG